MDLFHAVTQNIEQVLTCNWLTDFRSFKMGGDKTMATEPGGESTQYESIKTQTVPVAKQSGQLGSMYRSSLLCSHTHVAQLDQTQSRALRLQPAARKQLRTFGTARTSLSLEWEV